MEAKELQIGDYVINTEFGKNKADTIESVEPRRAWLTHGKTYVPIEFIEPIPLSPEILEKNGWVYADEDEKFAPCTWSGGGLTLWEEDDGGYRIVVTSDYDDEDTNWTPFVLHYVHELQHALKLRGIEKEIIL